MKPMSYNQRNGGPRKAFMHRSPTELSYTFSTLSPSHFIPPMISCILSPNSSITAWNDFTRKKDRAQIIQSRGGKLNCLKGQSWYYQPVKELGVRHQGGVGTVANGEHMVSTNADLLLSSSGLLAAFEELEHHDANLIFPEKSEILLSFFFLMRNLLNFTYWQLTQKILKPYVKSSNSPYFSQIVLIWGRGAHLLLGDSFEQPVEKLLSKLCQILNTIEKSLGNPEKEQTPGRINEWGGEWGVTDGIHHSQRFFYLF